MANCSSLKLSELVLLLSLFFLEIQAAPQAATTVDVPDNIDDGVVADPVDTSPPYVDDSTIALPVATSDDERLVIEPIVAPSSDSSTSKKRSFDLYSGWIDVKQEPHNTTFPDGVNYPLDIAATDLTQFYLAARDFSATQISANATVPDDYLNYSSNGLSLTIVPRAGAEGLNWDDYWQFANRLWKITAVKSGTTQTWSGVFKTEQKVPYVDIITSRAVIVHEVDAIPPALPQVGAVSTTTAADGGGRRLKKRAPITTEVISGTQNPVLRTTIRNSKVAIVAGGLLAAIITEYITSFNRFSPQDTFPSIDFQLQNLRERIIPTGVNAVFQLEAIGPPLTQTAMLYFLRKLRRISVRERWAVDAGNKAAIYGVILDDKKKVIAKWVVGDLLSNIPTCGFQHQGAAGAVANFFFGCVNVKKVEL